jgi:hypothetical protein
MCSVILLTFATSDEECSEIYQSKVYQLVYRLLIVVNLCEEVEFSSRELRAIAPFPHQNHPDRILL